VKKNVQYGQNLDALLDHRFVRYAYFLVLNTDDMSFDASHNETAVQGGGAGIQAAEFLASQRVETVFTGYYGPNGV